MFIGHFAPALAAATLKDAPRLPVLFLAAQLVDWAFFALLLTGAEAMRVTPGITVMNPMDLYHMPYTHSLLGALAFGGSVTVVIWALARGGNTRSIIWSKAERDGNGTTIVAWPRALSAGLIAGAVVVSHWFLDWLVHIPDLTLAGSEPKLGLGLWNHPMIAMPLELILIAGALLLYARRTGAGGLPLWGLAGVMALLQAVNWFGPVEAEVTAGTSLLAFFAFGLITLASGWAARRETRQ
jgi:hypothetical protein